jgi:enoyl-CoA hydratase/carnithine racemase
MTYETIKLEHDGTLVTLTLNRPEKMNSLSDQLLADFRAAMDVCERDDNVRAMIITGAGKAFSAGFDISPRERPRTTVQDWRDHAKDGNETWLRVWRSLRLHGGGGYGSIRRAGDRVLLGAALPHHALGARHEAYQGAAASG